MIIHRKGAKSAKIFILLRPGVQQNTLHPFGGANVHRTFARTPPHPSRLCGEISFFEMFMVS
jgi:hypothetical protein